MKIIWKRDARIAVVGVAQFSIVSEVRNELNERRKLHMPGEVVRAVNRDRSPGAPYMPRPFPLGGWRIIGIEPSGDLNYAPYKILTDARQRVPVWALDKEGGYDHPTGEWVEDYGYWLHWCSISKTTLGCGRVGLYSGDQIRLLVKLIETANETFLEVV